MELYLTDEDFKTAEANGISYVNAYSRFYSYGWSVEDAITIPVKKRSEGLWPRYKELAAKNGITQHNFYDRVKRGWTPEEASTRPKMPQQYHGKRTIPKEAYELAEKLGILKGTLKRRVYVYKWDPMEAATTPTNTLKRRKDLEATRIGHSF